MKETRKMYQLCSFKGGTEIVYDYRDEVKIINYGGKYDSISRGYDTEEELRRKEGVPDEPCKICNSPFSTHYQEPIKRELLENNLCFSCNFWTGIVAKKDTRIIMNDTVYVNGGNVAPEQHANRFIGFGGHEWKIQKEDGTIIETNNLWCNGDVPELFKPLLPDNAKVI